MKKKNGFYWGKVKIFLPATESFVVVKALIYGESGLCLTQCDPTKPIGAFSTVSHVNTGRRIGYSFYSTTCARYFCQAISSLMDWNTIIRPSDAGNYPKIEREIRAIRRIVVTHKANWKVPLVAWRLGGEE